jgi:predicted nucleic acid-binding protein
MIVVSNSSPLVSLAAIGRLDLLRELYGTVSIPRAVHDEVVVQGLGRPGAVEVQTLDWIVCQDVGEPNVVTALESQLDRGEAEAIALAAELQADLLLMDERLGRAEASRFGLRFIGVLGILIEAKGKGLVQRIEPILDELQNNAGFRVSEALRARVLRAAGESS